MNFKPMLSASLDGVSLTSLKYPLIYSPKLDGVRCIVWEGVAYSRNAKPIRNRFVQEWAKRHHNIDGELIVGSPTDPLCLNNTQSGVMAFDGEPDFQFHLFDRPQRYNPAFWDEYFRLHDYQRVHPHRLVVVPHDLVFDYWELKHVEENILRKGYEGIMLRRPSGPYKHGRSTLREGYLMKLKRFQDGEATVISLEEGSVNHNELTQDELGRAKRSKDSAGLVPSGMVGTIIAKDPQWGELRIAPGTMPHHDRVRFWDNPSLIVGKTIHWRSFGYGVKDKPRFPRYYGIREDK